MISYKPKFSAFILSSMILDEKHILNIFTHSSVECLTVFIACNIITDQSVLNRTNPFYVRTEHSHVQFYCGNILCCDVISSTTYQSESFSNGVYCMMYLNRFQSNQILLFPANYSSKWKVTMQISNSICTDIWVNKQYDLFATHSQPLSHTKRRILAQVSKTIVAFNYFRKDDVFFSDGLIPRFFFPSSLFHFRIFNAQHKIHYFGSFFFAPLLFSFILLLRTVRPIAFML